MPLNIKRKTPRLERVINITNVFAFFFVGKDWSQHTLRVCFKSERHELM